MIKTPFAIAATAAVGLSFAQPALGQSDKLGTVHFETSCKPDAQKLFDSAMLYQHSFWYRASQRLFEDVLKADPECGIAYWASRSACCGIRTPRRPRRISRRALPRSQRDRALAP